MIPNHSSSLGLARTLSASSAASVDSQTEEHQILEYVQNFKEEVEAKFQASNVNRNWVFPKQESEGNHRTHTRNSLASLENVGSFDLASDNVKRKLKEMFEKPRSSETEFLVDALTSVGKLNREYLQSQIKNGPSPLIRYIYLSLKKKLGKEELREREPSGLDKKTLDKQKVKKSARSIPKVNLSAVATTDFDSTSRFKASSGFQSSKGTPNAFKFDMKNKFKVSQRSKNELFSGSSKAMASPAFPTPKLKLSSRGLPKEINQTKSRTHLGVLLSAKSSEVTQKPEGSFRNVQNSLFQNFIRRMKGENPMSTRVISNRSQDKTNNASTLRLIGKGDKSFVGLGSSITKNQLENYVGKLLVKNSSRTKPRRDLGEGGVELQENRRTWNPSRDEILKEKLKKSFLKGKKIGGFN
jgi:hypothetical protein